MNNKLVWIIAAVVVIVIIWMWMGRQEDIFLFLHNFNNNQVRKNWKELDIKAIEGL